MVNLMRLRLIQFKAAYNLPVHVAREKGIFERQGLEVDFSYTPGSLYLAEALRKGEFEIGHTGADDVIADVEDYGGAPDGLFLFMGLHSGLLSLVGAPGMNTVESLRGKALAVDARASGFVFILEKLLRSKGFTPADYDFVEVGGWDQRYEALLDGKCSGTLLTPPFVGNALERGCHLIARGDQIIPCYQATGGAAKRSWAEKHRDVLVRYIRATILATQWCFEPKNRSQCVTLLGKHNGIRDQAAENTLDALLDPGYGIYREAELNLAGVEAALNLRAEMGFLRYPVPPVERYVDLSYYRKAVER
ncbi:MAG: ABC transporter substrate-binding protein [Deltaproteobacteria bacterium]|jgi:ABC-type nitrate/sulfonate/bicarbonate transport system substrate-binding protein